MASIMHRGAEEAAIIEGSRIVPVSVINEAEGTAWPADLSGIITGGHLEAIRSWYEAKRGSGSASSLWMGPASPLRFAPPYRQPRKIWGVGANYAEKADEMALAANEEPVCFMKPDTSLIGPGEPIVLPRGAGRVTAEAELAIIIGAACKNVEPADAMSYVGAFTGSLDMTAKDIHARNPRYLSRAKSFDTFFSFGPELVTPDEIDCLQELTVETVLNGRTVYGSHVANMIFSPAYIVSFFSRIMTLLPGDILMTGTPGSVEITGGDRVECRICGFAPLSNPVRSE
ncbi:fumarylacetoacetate hydrolase family protein [Paenibacillus pinistramenti]|uniref:fumarylacetoacetate hydrolase family protein n=1 Tax=Paenibacillus pinistramenti TaxID=1768003 RepID=UPI003083FFA7